MNQHNEKPLKEAIAQLIKAYGLKDRVTATRLQALWNQLMGPMIARHTEKLFIREGELYIQLDSAPLKQELIYAKAKIKEVINKELGEEFIKEVIIR